MGFVSAADQMVSFKTGDVLAFRAEDKYGVFQVLGIDKIVLQKGKKYNIAKIEIVAPEDDFFLCIPIRMTSLSYQSFDEIQSLLFNQEELDWQDYLIPTRPSGIYVDLPLFLGNYSISAIWEELYQEWRKAFVNGEAGVY